jgi:hypothetical protein
MEVVEHVSEMMDHSCTVQQASVVSGGYGHNTFDYVSPTATTLLVDCHYSPGGVREIISARTAGVDIQTHSLWMKYADAPTTLTVPGATLNHRITTIVRLDTGASVDAGPFDITDIVDMAGKHQLLRLMLKRIA